VIDDRDGPRSGFASLRAGDAENEDVSGGCILDWVRETDYAATRTVFFPLMLGVNSAPIVLMSFLR
jgi:hypothetical protein